MATNEQTPATESQVPESASEQEVNWGDLAVDADDDGAFVIEPEAPEPVEASAEEPPQVPEKPEPPTQAKSAPVSETATPPKQPEPTQGVQQAAQQQQPQTSPEEWLKQYHAHLQSQYAINEDDAAALVTQPEAVLPRLAANIHLSLMREFQQQIAQAMQNVPNLVQAQNARFEAEQRAKQEFYGEWPGLEQHHDLVIRNASLIRQANPNATRQQIIEMTGVMTAMGLGLNPAEIRRQQVQAAQAAAPRAPAPRPMRPAAPGPAPNSAPQVPQNIFSEFAEEDTDFLRG